jgi:hypothetical protein
MAANLGRMISDYRGLIETCRQRADELALSRAEIDRLGLLPDGYAGKLLGKAAVDDVSYPRKKSSKKMWPVALEAMLGVLGLKILLIEDDAATSKTLSRRVPVDHSNQRFDNKCNSKPVPKIAAPQIEQQQQPTAVVSRAHLRVVQSKRRGSKYG